MAENGKPTDFNFPSQGVQDSRAPSHAEVPLSDTTLGAVGRNDTYIPGETQARDSPEYLEEGSLGNVTLRLQREDIPETKFQWKGQQRGVQGSKEDREGQGRDGMAGKGRRGWGGEGNKKIGQH